MRHHMSATMSPPIVTCNHTTRHSPYSPFASCHATCGMSCVTVSPTGAAVVNGHIYVFGGESGRYESVERYTPSTDRWEDVTDMPTPRRFLTSATLQVSERSGQLRPA